MWTWGAERDFSSWCSLGSRASDSLSVTVTDMFFWQLSLPCRASQEMRAECCSATCDTSAAISVTSPVSSTGSDAGFKFMQLPCCSWHVLIDGWLRCERFARGCWVIDVFWRVSRDRREGSVDKANVSNVYWFYSTYVRSFYDIFFVFDSRERPEREKDTVSQGVPVGLIAWEAS